ncbi:hypothetical protein CMV_000476 [Castanea mollissima]|uniref:Uncharacterized protein n=1 Tax=Castanea mollissima TaxID=60419 RepID=A0A8J4S169_9ROSI|nr:hypothetical protein CMV_000476 [Castanea mollissima]
MPKSQLILPKHLERIQCKSLTYMNLESCQYLNFLKTLTSCFHLSEKWLLSRGKTSNLKDNIMRFNGLGYLLIEDSKFLKEIPELPESIKSVCASNCISLNSQSIRNLFDQFGRILDFPPNMICSREKGNVLADSHSHRIDYSSRHSFSKFFLIVKELLPLKDNYAKKCGSLRDDRISWFCAVDISINGQAQSFMRQPIFQYLKCDHLWFYAVPHSQLQQKFGDLLQGDQNCVEISCKISHWTSEFGKFAPVIAGMGAHVKCICPPQNSIIIDNYSQNVDDNSDNTEFAPLLLPATTSDGSHMNHVSLNGRRRRHRRTSTSSNR